MYCCVPGSDCFEWVKTIAPVIVTVIFGALAYAITRRQNKVAEAKLKLDLFERRFKIFQLIWDAALDTARRGARVQERDNLFTPFSNFIPEAAFLFGKDIEFYILELADQWTALHRFESSDFERMMNSTGTQPSSGLLELRAWFSVQANTVLKSKFSPYLDFSNWK
jgi:hypothetical protein